MLKRPCITALLMWLVLLHSLAHQLGACHYDELNTSVPENGSNIIYLLTLLPYPEPDRREGSMSFQPAWDRGSGLLPAAELAVQHINQDPNTLKGYKVKLMHADGDCNLTSKTLISYIQHVFYADKSWLLGGIIGPTCSESTIAISSITGRAGLALPNVHIASSAELENRGRYPYTFGVVGSTTQLVKALFSLIHYNKWKKVALLYDDSRAFFYANDRLRDIINSQKSTNGGFITYHSAVYDTFFPIDSLQQSTANVIAITTTLVLAQKIMCIASEKNISFPQYQWIIVGYSHEEFIQGETKFKYNGKMYVCNWMRRSVLEQQLFVHFRLHMRSDNLPLVSGRTFQEVVKDYIEYVNVSNYSDICPEPIIPNVWATAVYDAVWALVLAIDMAESVFHSCMNISDILSDKIAENFQHISFRGTSGYIVFDNETGFVDRFVDVHQVISGTATLVSSIFKDNVSFNDILVPEISKRLYETVNYFLAAIFVLIEVFILIATGFVHIVTVFNSKYPTIKASSPALNQFFFLGCYTLGVVAIIYILVMKALALPNHTVGNACNVFWIWLVPVAITLTFGILIVKTWRIYRIFIHFTEPGPLSNKVLIMTVLVQLGVDVALGTVWSTISPIRLIIVEEHSYTNENGDTILPRQCVFTNTEYWLVLLGVYKSLQVVLLILLCFLTRNVKDKRFNTVSISRASYLGLLLITTLFPLYVILWYTNAPIDADFIVLCVFFSGNGLVFLIFVLVPPILPLLSKIYYTTCKSS